MTVEKLLGVCPATLINFIAKQNEAKSTMEANGWEYCWLE